MRFRFGTPKSRLNYNGILGASNGLHHVISSRNEDKGHSESHAEHPLPKEAEEEEGHLRVYHLTHGDGACQAAFARVCLFCRVEGGIGEVAEEHGGGQCTGAEHQFVRAEDTTNVHHHAVHRGGAEGVLHPLVGPYVTEGHGGSYHFFLGDGGVSWTLCRRRQKSNTTQ